MSLAADGLPPLREVVAAHGLAAKKSLGQNFLFDLNLTGRIARASGPLEGVAVVEVGPGPGGLTRDPKGRGSYSASGIYGDATLATREKGEQIMNQMVINIAADIEKLRAAPVPAK